VDKLAHNDAPAATDLVDWDLTLTWLALDPDSRCCVAIKTIGPLELCSVNPCAAVTLRLASDGSPSLTGVALSVRSLVGDGALGTTRAVLLVVETVEADCSLLNSAKLD
jgi:hypothetical protein